MVLYKEIDVSSGLQVVAKLHDEASMEGGKDKRKWRGRRTWCILADYRYRRYAPCYRRLGCLKCLLVNDGIWYWYITDTRSAQVYATWNERRKIRWRRRQPDDEEGEEGRPRGVATKLIPSDSLFIFRRAYLRLTLCSVRRALYLTPFTSFTSCGAIFKNVIEQRCWFERGKFHMSWNLLSCSWARFPRATCSKVYQIFSVFRTFMIPLNYLVLSRNLIKF